MLDKKRPKHHSFESHQTHIQQPWSEIDTIDQGHAYACSQRIFHGANTWPATWPNPQATKKSRTNTFWTPQLNVATKTKLANPPKGKLLFTLWHPKVPTMQMQGVKSVEQTTNWVVSQGKWENNKLTRKSKWTLEVTKPPQPFFIHLDSCERITPTSHLQWS